MRPKSKWDRVVLAEVIVEAGLTLIAEAELPVKLPKLTRARMVRNGRMLAVLAQCPIRLKNFAALEIGRSIVKIDDTWSVRRESAIAIMADAATASAVTAAWRQRPPR
jgi:hypothetical protein